MNETERQALMDRIYDRVDAHDSAHDVHEQTPDWETPQKINSEREDWELLRQSHAYVLED